jgi:hypothetical protein
VGIVVIAARQRPQGPIGPEPATADRRRLLLVVTCPLEDSASIGRIAEQVAGSGGPEERAEVMVLAPARIGFLDRWASDVEGARQDAQRNLVLTAAALAKAGVSAEARVGDEDVVQAVEDAVGDFPVTDVMLVGPEGETDRAVEAAAAELESRLRAHFRRLWVNGRAAH